MRVVGQNDVILNRSSIQNQKSEAAASMMPQGLLNTLSDEEIINLLGYLTKATR